MFNVLLDALPDDYKGHKINTNFDIGIQITQAVDDEELTETERIQVALMLLYPDCPEDIGEAYEGLIWFLTSWNMDNHQKKKSEVQVMDFDIDQWRIYAAFRNQYNINLNKENLHYWEFMALLSNLNECAFTRVIDIRDKKISTKMTKEEKKAYAEAKRIYGLKKKIEETYTPEEQERINEFLKYANQRGDN